MRAVVAVVLCALSFACEASSAEPTTQPKPEPEPTVAPAEREAETPPPKPVTETETGLCVTASADDWVGCIGKRVELHGKRPEFVGQHPMLSQPEGLSPDNSNTHQGYMDTDTAQIIVLTSAPFDCPAGMTAVGMLFGVKVSDDPDAVGKDTYGGWSLSDATVTCK